MKNMSKQKYKLLLTWTNLAILLIVVLAIFTRFYKLADLPVGLHDDEAAAAYDAYSLAYWRVNRQLMHLPVYLPNYGSGQSALYSYLTAISIRIFDDVNPFVIRLVPTIFSLITVLCGSLIVKDALGKKAGLLAAFLLTIFPYFIMQGRFGLDCNLLLGTMTLAFYLLLLAIKRQKLIWWILAGSAFGLSLYSYALSWIIAPIFLSATFIYLWWLKKANIKQTAAFALPLLFFAVPLILFVIVNVFGLDTIYSRFFYIPKLMKFRTGDFSWGDPMLRLLEMPQALLHINAYDNFESLMPGWMLYAVSVPFLLLGLVQVVKKTFSSVKERIFSVEALISFWLVAEMILTILLGTTLHLHNSIYLPLAFSIIGGIVWSARLIKNQQRRLIFIAIVAIIYSISFIHFTYQYFEVFSRQGYQTHFDDTPQPALAGLDEWAATHGVSQESLAQREIWIDVKYVFYYLGAKTSPFESSSTVSVLNEVRFRNLHFEFLPKIEAFFDFIPTEINPRDIFILSNKDSSKAYMQDLEELGLQEIYRDQKWSVWLDPSTFLNDDEATLE